MTTNTCNHTTSVRYCDWCRKAVNCWRCRLASFGVWHRLEYVKDQSLAIACHTCYQTRIDKSAYTRIESYANNKEDIPCDHPSVITCRHCSKTVYCYVCRRLFVARYHQTEERDHVCDGCAERHKATVRFSFPKYT